MDTTFRTKVEIPCIQQPIKYSDKLFFNGSCFAENIGSLFSEHQFNCMVNPFGVVYNPASVAQSLERIINAKQFNEADLVWHNNLWHHFDLHGSFSSNNKNTLLSSANQSLNTAHQQLKETKLLIVTFGTAWIFQLKNSNQIVANCHKHPASSFLHNILSVNDIYALWQTLVQRLKEFNPGIRIIMTVSPVRHWKNGAHGNNVSKAVLLLAIEQLIQSNKEIEYFPAYEIMLDELRDYRFYADDMLHPSKIAQSYIFRQFCEYSLDEKASEMVKDVEKINAALNHRPLQGVTSEHIAFVKSTITRIEKLKSKYPLINNNMLLNRAKKVLNDMDN